MEEDVEQFKREVVFKNMHEEEERDDTYGKWLNLHDNQATPEFDYLNSKGVIREPVYFLARRLSDSPLSNVRPHR